ncbi:hypothetical protein SGCOL_003376 [Colletotrichum sp. CLE4]
MEKCLRCQAIKTAATASGYPVSLTIEEALLLTTEETLPPTALEPFQLTTDGAPWGPKIFFAYHLFTKKEIEEIVKLSDLPPQDALNNHCLNFLQNAT